MHVTDVEIATVTDTSVIITWFTGSTTSVDEYGFPAPVATDSELRLAPFNTTTLTAGTYQTVYYKNRTPLALAWAQRTRHEYYSLYPHYMLGTIADRNHTVVRDLSGLA